jgi:hypothetical protein
MPAQLLPAQQQTLMVFLSTTRRLEEEVSGLSDEDLDHSLEPGSWSIRQIVHHVADDGDVWCMIFKKALATPGAPIRFEGFPGNESWAKALSFNNRSITAAIHLLRAHGEMMTELATTFPDSWNQCVKIVDESGNEVQELSAGQILDMLGEHLHEHLLTIQMIKKTYQISTPVHRESILSSRFQYAFNLAFHLHGGTFRKSTSIPTMGHLLSVCSLVMYDGGSEDEAIAALLHDALEDAPESISPELIKEHFGDTVLKIVRVSSDTAEDYKGGPKEPWRVRKERYIEDIKKTDPSLLRVTVADKVDNARAIVRDLNIVGDKVWERFNAGKSDQQWYYGSTLEAYKMAGFRGYLFDELEKLVGQILAS